MENKLKWGVIGSGGIARRRTIPEGITQAKNAKLGYEASQDRNLSDGVRINPTAINPYLAEIEEFSKAIIEKREPVNNHLIGLQSQKVLAACYQSAKTGKVVHVKY